MSEQGGPYGPSGQGYTGQGWAPGGPAGGPPSGPQGWQQPAPPPAGQWQNGPAGQPPTGPQGWQQPAPQAWQNGPTGRHPTPPQGWQQPPTQQFPPQGPGGPGQPWSGQQPAVPPPGKSGTPIIITALAVVVALVAGVGIWYFAIRDKDSQTASGGQGSPQESVTALFTTLGNSDPIGLADQLDPAEAKLFTDLNADVITELKRLEVLSPAASADSMTGTKISVSGLTFAGPDETITDNLRIVKLTGGTITISSDPDNIPLSDKIKGAFGDQIDQAQPQSQTVNIADAVAENGGDPIRVATVKRGDNWYVSLFYTIADNAVHQAGLPNPTTADQIPAVGQASPEDAVNAFITAASAGNLEDVIKVLPPDEMGALHDYGKLLIQQADAGSLTSDMTDLGVSVDNVSWVQSDVTGGAKLSIKSLSLTADGQTVTIQRDATSGSVTLTVPDQPAVTLDESTIDNYLTDTLGASSTGLDPQLLDIIKREFKQVIGLGLVTVKVGDSWYVSPIRSFSDVFVSLLKGLQPGDVDYLISLSGN